MKNTFLVSHRNTTTKAIEIEATDESLNTCLVSHSDITTVAIEIEATDESWAVTRHCLMDSVSRDMLCPDESERDRWIAMAYDSLLECYPPDGIGVDTAYMDEHDDDDLQAFLRNAFLEIMHSDADYSELTIQELVP